MAGTGIAAAGLYGAYRYGLLDTLIAKVTGQKVYRAYIYQGADEHAPYIYGFDWVPPEDRQEGDPAFLYAQADEDMDALIVRAVDDMRDRGVTETAQIPKENIQAAREKGIKGPFVKVIRGE